MSEKLPSSYEQAIGTFNASDKRPSVMDQLRAFGDACWLLCYRLTKHMPSQPDSVQRPNAWPLFRLWRYGRKDWR